MMPVAHRAQLDEPFIATIGLEEALPLDDALLNLRVARQSSRARPHAEALCGFPLRHGEVLDAVLDHESSRLFGELET